MKPPISPEEWRKWENERWEAVEAFKAKELKSMTEAQARQIIQGLAAVEGWRFRPDWSGLVEQQAIFLKGRQK